MTAALSPETALDIVASFGADLARWPADSRAAVLALAAVDAGVAAALAEAIASDSALTEWANAPATGAAVDVAAILKLPQEQNASASLRATWRPALMAASVALVVAVGGWAGLSGRFTDTKTEITAVSPSAEAAEGEADAAFAMVFTPTAAEEDLI